LQKAKETKEDLGALRASIDGQVMSARLMQYVGLSNEAAQGKVAASIKQHNEDAKAAVARQNDELRKMREETHNE